MTGVRRAGFNDTKVIVDFLERYHVDESNLSDIPFDRKSMTQVTDYYIGTPKHVVFVYVDSSAEIKGVLMGAVEPFMFNQKRLWATDLVFVAKAGGAWLLKKFIAWSRLFKVDRIMMGVSTGNSRSDDLYIALGLERTGGMYTMKFSEEL